MAELAGQAQGTSEDTKTIVTVLLLIFVFPIGLILMWAWTKWPVWVKLLVSIPLLFFFLFIIGLIALPFLILLANPTKQLEKASQSGYDTCIRTCSTSNQTPEQKGTCILTCSQQYLITPAISPIETSEPTQ